MKRGEIWWVNLDPTIGTEIKKKRPAVVISNDTFSESMNHVQVIPCTSQKTNNVYYCESLLSIKGKKSKALVDQIRTVSKNRLGEKIGKVSDPEMARIEKSIRAQFAL